MRRDGLGGLVFLLPVLLGCSAGHPSTGFVSPQVTNAYIPLFQSSLIFGRWGAAVAIEPHVAVTNDHNLNFIEADLVLARSRDYDLLFFRTDRESAPAMAEPHPGQPVIAYGQGSDNGLREAKGAVVSVSGYIAPRCEGCARQRTLVFDADAGRGFSGGPVVDATTGAVLGITFGYLDRQGEGGGRRMYAYDIDLVKAEMRRLLDRR